MDGGAVLPLNGDRERIVRALEHDIVFGSKRPDERILEDELIARFGATRHAVRRAIDDLAALGLVTKRPNRGARVISFSLGEIEDLYEVRGLLQAHAIKRMELPLDRPTLDEMARLNEAHIEANKAGDAHKVFELNNAFHNTLFMRCGNRLLASEVRAYAWRTHAIRFVGYLDASYMAVAQKDHAAILEAAETGDRAELMAVDRRHIMRPKDAYIAKLMLDD